MANVKRIGASALILGWLASPAFALNARTWVSGAGVDQASCGTIASPCRTLQYAHDQTAASGEINFKDAAGYGSVIISKAISIINDGAGVAGVLAPANGNAILIVAGASGDVVLKGLTIEGSGTGNYGVLHTIGRNLTIVDCYISGFKAAGIFLNASGTTATTVASTRLFGNEVGLSFRPPAGQGTGTIEVRDVTASFNQNGLSFISELFAVNVGISNTVVSNNYNSGITISRVSGFMTTILDGVVLNSNNLLGISSGNLGGFGLYHYSGTTSANDKLYIGRSTIMGNNYGTFCINPATAFSFGNNQIVGNNLDNHCTLTPVVLK